MKKKKQYMITVTAGILLVLLAIFFQVMTDYSPVIILTFVNMGTIMIIIGALALNRTGVHHDERTKMLGSKALSVSWFITFVAINILFWVDELQLIELSAKAVLSILMPLMLLTGSGLQWWMRNHGDRV